MFINVCDEIRRIVKVHGGNGEPESEIHGCLQRLLGLPTLMCTQLTALLRRAHNADQPFEQVFDQYFHGYDPGDILESKWLHEIKGLPIGHRFHDYCKPDRESMEQSEKPLPRRRFFAAITTQIHTGVYI